MSFDYLLREQSQNKWGDPISKERQRELQGYFDKWENEQDHGERRGPFDRAPEEFGVRLTGADVFWLAEQVRDKEFRVGKLHLEGAFLGADHLEGAVLTGRTWRLSMSIPSRANWYNRA